MNQENVKEMFDVQNTDSVGLYWSAIVTGTFLNQRLLFPEAIKNFHQNYAQEFNTLLCQISYDFAQNWVEYRTRITSSSGSVQTPRFAAAGGR